MICVSSNSILLCFSNHKLSCCWQKQVDLLHPRFSPSKHLLTFLLYPFCQIWSHLLKMFLFSGSSICWNQPAPPIIKSFITHRVLESISLPEDNKVNTHRKFFDFISIAINSGCRFKTDLEFESVFRGNWSMARVCLFLSSAPHCHALWLKMWSKIEFKDKLMNEKLKENVKCDFFLL